MNQYYFSDFGSNNCESFIKQDSESLKKYQTSNNVRQQLISKIVLENNLIELKSDYLGMDSYYYNKERKTMYKVSNVCDYTNNINPAFEVSYDRHIIELNNLPI